MRRVTCIFRKIVEMFPTMFVYLIFLSAASHYFVSSSSELSGKIYGGKKTGGGQKYMISLQVNEKHFCCGFLVSWRFALSSGFCTKYFKMLKETNVLRPSVFYGNANLDLRTGAHHRVNIACANPHPEYDEQNSDRNESFNIGYVLFEEELEMKKFNLTAIDVSTAEVSQATHFFTYGWGSTEIQNSIESPHDVTMTTKLMGLELEMVESENCENAIGRKLKTDEMCLAAFLNAGTCTLGDAGSPVVRHRSAAVGITTVVNIIANNHPIVCTKIAPYAPYIEELQKEFPCKQQIRVPWKNRLKRKEEIGESSVPNEDKKKQCHQNEEYEELPDLNIGIEPQD